MKRLGKSFADEDESNEFKDNIIFEKDGVIVQFVEIK